MKNNILIRLLACILGFVLAVAILAGTVCVYLNSPASPQGEAVLFHIQKGSSALGIANSLADAGLIRSSDFAYLYTRMRNLTLKAGTYRLSPGQSTAATIRYIAAGKQESVRVTVPEGLSLLKTARHLEDAGVVGEKDFLAAARDPGVLSRYGLKGRTAEGFLFPDTYFFPYGSDAETVVAIMVDTFFKRTAEIPNLPTSPGELYDKVVLASIIEREYRVASEAPLISSVFMNRLKIGMGLQSCATVEYIITEIQGKPHPGRLLVSDLEIQSDYNTYLWAGLPPGPISSPGRVALDAAMNPADTNYLYFRLTDSENGTHSFTHSLGEHVKAGKLLDLKKAAGK